ncbi:hypothetical protein M0802_012240 [Mischocyttarus mexicanus]|nr:hypothetical protein M0802_012240 [Mischocyttarus mexicanus]
MDEIIFFQEQLSRIQLETYKRQEELDKKELELEKQKKELEQKERMLELKEDEVRRSVEGDFVGFRGFGRLRIPVGPFVPLSRTPVLSHPNSPQAALRRKTPFPDLDSNDGLRREIEDLRRELNLMRRITPFAPHPPSPLPRSSYISFKLWEITETIPRFDRHNIPVSQFSKACRRALESLPSDHSSEVETSLIRPLLPKLSGHAYIVVENVKINKVEQLIERFKDAFLPSHGSNYYQGQLATEFMKPGEHVLDYFSRMRELTQSIVDEEAKQIGHLEHRVERKIEEEGLDAFMRSLPRDYRIAMRFEKLEDFNAALICLLKVDKQIQEDRKRVVSPTFKNQVVNIRPINGVKKCSHCKKDGHLEETC